MGQLICTACGKQLNTDTRRCSRCGCHYFHRPQANELGTYYQRAFTMRMEGRFADAIHVYQDILAVSHDQVEAHRGIAYARYGVVWISNGEEAEGPYPEEEVPKKEEAPFRPSRIPTLQIMREQPFLEDPDYLQAHDCLNLTQQTEIEEDARPIHLIQEQILEMADSRPAYDIFLCYNMLTGSEETHRKVRELNLFLSEEGYRVYSMADLLDYCSTDIAITYALWTAPVMIVLGGEEVDFYMPEVSDLWHRFQYLIPTSSKLIIPVYRDMSPDRLPAGFSMMPCMNYSVIGFSNRLLRTIDKQFRKPEPNLQEDNRTANRLKKSGQVLLRLRNYKKAFEVYEELYTRFPDHYEGWWGMIVSKTRNFTDTHLDQKEINDWYRCARLLAKESPEFLEHESEFIAYKKNVYGGLIQKDRQNVLDMVDHVNSRIRSIRQASEELEATMLRSEQQYTASCKEMNLRLREIAHEQEELQERSDMCKRIILLGILLSIGGLLFVHDASSTLTSALVFLGFIIIIMGIVILKTGHVKESLEDLEEEKDMLKDKYSMYKRKYEEYMNSQALTLTDNRSDESHMQAFVDKSALWLDMDDDALFDNILAEEMQGTGMIFSTNPELITLRKELDNEYQKLF